MKRKLEHTLSTWLASQSRQPLLVLGARQVGKTHLVEQFARQNFADALLVNFQVDLERLTALFKKDLDPRRILRDLATLYGKTLKHGETLLVFDEIQLCQPALSSLKYFAERAPEIPIIATGSLFGITVHRDAQYSFPVGKITLAHLYPLDFEEYLWALDKHQWAAAIRTCFEQNEPFIAHREVAQLYREYLMVGGMPAAVNQWRATHEFGAVRETQRSLSALYTSDMAIYLDDVDASRARGIWESIPRQLARETGSKFKLNDVYSGARQYQLQAPFTWLENAGLVFRHKLVVAANTPFVPKEGGSYFKAYLLDVGLLSARMNIIPEVFLSEEGYRQIAAGFRGALAENYVKQSLEANGVESYYWSSGNTAEIDFLVQDAAMRAVPLDVKSANNVRSKSLAVFREKYAPRCSVRLSLAEFGQQDGIRTIPLYAAFCLNPAAL